MRSYSFINSTILSAVLSFTSNAISPFLKEKEFQVILPAIKEFLPICSCYVCLFGSMFNVKILTGFGFIPGHVYIVAGGSPIT